MNVPVQQENNRQQSILHMLYFQYNYNHSTVLTVRDRFCQAVFVKISQCYARGVSHNARMAIEFSLLAMAILCSIALSYMHGAFIRSPIVCLDHVDHRWFQDGILRVEVLRNSHGRPYTLEQSYLKELAIEHNLGYSHFRMSEVARIMNDQHDTNNNDNSYSFGKALRIAFGAGTSSSSSKDLAISIPKDLLGLSNRSYLVKDHDSNYSDIELLRETLREFEKYRNGIWPSEEFIVEYSLDYGLLRLSPAARHRLNVPVHLVTLDTERNACFGDSFSRSVLRHTVGYNDVLMASLKRLAEKEASKGYVKNVITAEHFRFIKMWTTRSSYVTAALVMLIFTLSISMLMRYTHHQIFALIVDVLHLLEFNSGTSFRTAPLLTVVLALVGLEAIMSEFFNNSSTAFGVIFIVWLADHFSAVCCHTRVSKNHWPKFFFLYHFVFYAYDYRFNGQNSGLALLTTIFYTLHSMVFFYHRFEMPALAQAEEAQAEQETDIMPGQRNSIQPTQFVISARVTVTRRVENQPTSPVSTETENNANSGTQNTDEDNNNNSRDSQEPERPQDDNNRTRKLSTSSAEASSCGCCSSNDMSDPE